MFGPRQALERQSCYFWRAEDENKPSPHTLSEQQPGRLQEISAKNRGRVKVAARAAAINGVVDRKKVNCQLCCYMINHFSHFSSGNVKYLKVPVLKYKNLLLYFVIYDT